MSLSKSFVLLDNYIYISHLGDDGEYLVIPTTPDSIQDTMTSTFVSQNALSRSAPVWTYSNSGPREVQVALSLHRDLMDDVNVGVSNIELEDGEDYIDVFIRKLQSISVPKYNVSNKFVEPPMVAVRFADEIFIKGIVTGPINVTYSKPVLANNKFANVSIAFTVYETDPYDATSIAKNGSFRGITRGMRKGFHLED